WQGRGDLLAYAAEHGIPVSSTPKASETLLLGKPERAAGASYSIDENLYHTSYESGILEDPMTGPPAEMFKMTVAPE
ncbi:unnamed protein product, partial [Discosporangium mesarthrocarpum]